MSRQDAADLLLVLTLGAFSLFLLALLVNAFNGHKPTTDQIYGCTIKQQAPNGECQ